MSHPRVKVKVDISLGFRRGTLERIKKSHFHATILAAGSTMFILLICVYVFTFASVNARLWLGARFLFYKKVVYRKKTWEKFKKVLILHYSKSHKKMYKNQESRVFQESFRTKMDLIFKETLVLETQVTFLYKIKRVSPNRRLKGEIKNSTETVFAFHQITVGKSKGRQWTSSVTPKSLHLPMVAHSHHATNTYTLHYVIA